MNATQAFTFSHPDLDVQRPFDVAVVITTLVRDTLARAVESIYSQDFDGSLQILIGIDDPNADLRQLEELVGKCPSHMAVSVVNPGYSSFVLNGGLYPGYGGVLPTVLSYLANARYVAYLDDDNWWGPSHISDLNKAIANHDWAFALRWFFDPDTLEILCIDDWESVGPGGGIFAKGHFKGQHYYDGFVDPSVLMIDKLACESALQRWTTPTQPNGAGTDRSLFGHLKKFNSFNCTYKASSYYELDPNDPIHPDRSRRIERARKRQVFGEPSEEKLGHLPAQIKASYRKWVVRKLGRGLIGAEIGVSWGEMAEQLFKQTRPAELHLIDPWGLDEDRSSKDGPQAQAGGGSAQDYIHQQVLTRFSKPIQQGRIRVHRQTWQKAAELFPDEHFDWICFDRDQPSRQAELDLELAWRKLKRRGWLICTLQQGGGANGTNMRSHVDKLLARGGAELLKVTGDQFVVCKNRKLGPQPRNEPLVTRRTPTIMEIRERTRQGDQDVVSSNDFWTYNQVQSHLDTVTELRDISPYCFDDRARHALFVEVPGGTDLTESEVHHRKLYENASRLISIPYEYLSAYFGEQDLSPVFVLSIERTGANLLRRLLALMPGVATLSDPGMYHQVASMRADETRKVGEKRENELTKLLFLATQCHQKSLNTSDLQRFVVKLSGQCIRISHLLARAFPAAKFVFMYRDPGDWARESIAAGVRADELIEYWDEAKQRFQQVLAGGGAVYPLSYDELRTDAGQVLTEVARFCELDKTPTTGACQAVMDQYSTGDARTPSKISQDARHQTKRFLAHIDGESTPFTM